MLYEVITYRLKLWGLCVNVLANVLIAVFVTGGFVDFAGVLVVVLVSTAIAQLGHRRGAQGVEHDLDFAEQIDRRSGRDRVHI